MSINPTIDGRAESSGGSRPVTSPDDNRLKHNPKHEPTDESRAKVKDLSRVCSTGQIAILMGVSDNTIRKHYTEEIELGRAQTGAAIGTKMIEKALSGHFGSMAFTLSRRFDWSEKHIVKAPGGMIRNYDLSGRTPEDLEKMLPLLDELISNANAQNTGDDTDAA